MNIGFSEKLFSTFCGKKLFCGFSGGADSTAALLLALKFRDKFDLQITAVHINHHLRGAESDKEAEEAEKFAGDHQVEFRRFDVQLGTGSNMEARAREARLHIWQQLCAGEAESAVVLGHHADDRMENLLLRMGRGSNVSGLTGLRMVSTIGGVKFIRPLYNWRKREIEAFLRSENVCRWALDSSNEEVDISRNALRKNILPELIKLLPSGDAGILRSLEMLERDALYLEEIAENMLEQSDPYSADFWKSVPEALMPRVLRKFAAGVFGADKVFSGDSVERFAEAVRSDKNGIVTLGYGESLQISNGKISEVPEKYTLPEKIWQWQRDETAVFGDYIFRVEECANDDFSANSEDRAFFNAGDLPEKLILALPQPGETMVPFGRQTAVKLKKLRVDRKVPAAENQPVMKTCGGEILWYPHIRRGAKFPASGNGKKVCFCCLKKDFGEKR